MALRRWPPDPEDNGYSGSLAGRAPLPDDRHLDSTTSSSSRQPVKGDYRRPSDNRDRRRSPSPVGRSASSRDTRQSSPSREGRSSDMRNSDYSAPSASTSAAPRAKGNYVRPTAASGDDGRRNDDRDRNRSRYDDRDRDRDRERDRDRNRQSREDKFAKQRAPPVTAPTKGDYRREDRAAGSSTTGTRRPRDADEGSNGAGKPEEGEVVSNYTAQSLSGRRQDDDQWHNKRQRLEDGLGDTASGSRLRDRDAHASSSDLSSSKGKGVYVRPADRDKDAAPVERKVWPPPGWDAERERRQRKDDKPKDTSKKGAFTRPARRSPSPARDSGRRGRDLDRDRSYTARRTSRSRSRSRSRSPLSNNARRKARSPSPASSTRSFRRDRDPPPRQVASGRDDASKGTRRRSRSRSCSRSPDRPHGDRAQANTVTWVSVPAQTTSAWGATSPRPASPAQYATRHDSSAAQPYDPNAPRQPSQPLSASGAWPGPPPDFRAPYQPHGPPSWPPHPPPGMDLPPGFPMPPGFNNVPSRSSPTLPFPPPDSMPPPPSQFPPALHQFPPPPHQFPPKPFPMPPEAYKPQEAYSPLPFPPPPGQFPPAPSQMLSASGGFPLPSNFPMPPSIQQPPAQRDGPSAADRNLSISFSQSPPGGTSGLPERQLSLGIRAPPPGPNKAGSGKFKPISGFASPSGDAAPLRESLNKFFPSDPSDAASATHHAGQQFSQNDVNGKAGHRAVAEPVSPERPQQARLPGLPTAHAPLFPGLSTGQSSQTQGMQTQQNGTSAAQVRESHALPPPPAASQGSPASNKSTPSGLPPKPSFAVNLLPAFLPQKPVTTSSSSGSASLPLAPMAGMSQPSSSLQGTPRSEAVPAVLAHLAGKSTSQEASPLASVEREPSEKANPTPDTPQQTPLQDPTPAARDGQYVLRESTSASPTWQAEAKAAPSAGQVMAAPMPKVVSSELYERLAQVGEGTYGKVYKARRQDTGKLVALKRIRMEAEKDGFPVTAIREIKLLQSLDHPNVVKLMEMMVSKGHVYMVSEYLEHDLTGILNHPFMQSTNFSAANLKSLMQQLLAGLDYIHWRGVLHRDLKGSNILLGRNGDLKIADFGLAKFYDKRARNDYTNRVITLWYKPPELLFGETVYGPEVDMWSAGCIFLELFTKKPVFQGQDELHQLDVIYRFMGTPSLDAWPELADLPWYELVKPRAEVSSVFRETFADPYLKSPMAVELAEALLSFNPSRRPTAAQALQMPYFTSDSEPKAEKPIWLAEIKGDWHEMESKEANKKKGREARKQQQQQAKQQQAQLQQNEHQLQDALMT